MSQHSAVNPQHYFYHADGNGNITALINAQQILVAKYLYDPFGNILSKSGPLAENNRYCFSSKECDQNSGLIYYLYRFYDPSCQRWISRDPLTEIGGINLYSYVFNSPINLIDADGKYATIVIGAVVGAVWGGITGGWTGGWQGAISGAVGGAVGGAAIGAGAPPSVAGALAGISSSVTGQLLNGDNPLSGDSLGQDAVSGVLGGVFGNLGSKIGGDTGTRVAVGLASAVPKTAGKVYVKCMSAAKNAVKRLGTTRAGQWRQTLDDDE